MKEFAENLKSHVHVERTLFIPPIKGIVSRKKFTQANKPTVQITLRKPVTREGLLASATENRFTPGGGTSTLQLRSNRFSIIFEPKKPSELIILHHVSSGRLTPRERERIAKFITDANRMPLF